MIKIYLKQAWTIIRQNKLFSSIYITGTALAIAITMTLFVIYYVKVAPIYPEYNRWNTYVINELFVSASIRSNDGEIKKFASSKTRINRSIIPDILSKIENIEVCTATADGFANNIFADNGKSLREKMYVKYTDLTFWKVFTFEFVDGRPFVEGEMIGKPQHAIISSRLAKRLFASTDVTGRKIEVDERSYSIAGVVKNPSSFAMDSYAEIYIPSSIKNSTPDKPFTVENSPGIYSIYFTIKSHKHSGKMTDNIQNTIKRLNTESSDAFKDASSGDRMLQIDEFKIKPHWKAQLDNDSSRDSLLGILQRLMVLVISLLIVPAINLSSMISSRMEERKAEIGVRLAFGATKGSIMKQILWENMLLTCIGGIAGLLLTYLLVYTGAEWVLTIFDSGDSFSVMERDINADMLFNPYIFITVFIISIIINMASAWIPAHWSLKHTIADSLNSKKQ